MIRALNLVANFSVNNAEFTTGMRKIEASVAQVTAKLNSMDTVTEATAAKAKKLNEHLSSLVKNRGDMIQAYGQRLAAIEQDANDRLDKILNKNSADRKNVSQKIREMENAVSVNEKYNAKILELNKRLTTDLQANFNKQKQLREEAALKEMDAIETVLSAKRKAFNEETQLKLKQVREERAALNQQIEDNKKAIDAIKKKRDELASRNIGPIAQYKAAYDERALNIASNTNLSAAEKAVRLANNDTWYNRQVARVTRPVLQSQDEEARLLAAQDAARKRMSGTYMREQELSTTPMTLGKLDQAKQDRYHQLYSSLGNYGMADFLAEEQAKVGPLIAKLHAERAQKVNEYLTKNASAIATLRAKLDATDVSDNEARQKHQQAIDKLSGAKDKFIAKIDAEIDDATHRLAALTGLVDARRAEYGPRAAAAQASLHHELITQYARRMENYDYAASRTGMGLMVGAMALGGTTKVGADLNTTLLKEQHSTSLTKPEDILLMRNSIKQLGMESGQSFEAVASGFRLLENYGFGASDTVKVLTSSMKAAVATGADLNHVADAVGKSLVVWRGKAIDADKYTNVLAKTAQLSSLEMDQLASVFGKTGGMVGNLGLSFIETAAALALLTKQGLTGSEAGTQLRNSVQKITAPDKSVRKLLQMYQDQTGVGLVRDFSIEGLKEKGLAGIFADIQKTADIKGISREQIASSLFPNQRGLQSALFLTKSDTNKQFQDIVKANRDSFGNAEQENNQRYIESLNDMNTSLGRIKNTFTVLAADIATAFEPTIKRLVDLVKGLTDWFTNLSPEVKKAAADMTLWGFALGGAIVVVARLGQAIAGIQLAATLGGVAISKVATAVKELHAGTIIATIPGNGLPAIANWISRIQIVGTTLAAFFSNPWVIAIGAATIAIAGLISYLKQQEGLSIKTVAQVKEEAKAREEVGRKMVAHATGASALLKVITDLQSKTNRSAAESESLRVNLNKLADMAPNLITGYDNMGNAIGTVADAQKRLNRELDEGNKKIWESQTMLRVKLRADVGEQIERTSGLRDFYQGVLTNKKVMDTLNGRGDSLGGISPFDQYVSDFKQKYPGVPVQGEISKFDFSKEGGAAAFFAKQVRDLTGALTELQNKQKSMQADDANFQKGFDHRNGYTSKILPGLGGNKGGGTGNLNTDDNDLMRRQKDVSYWQSRMSQAAERYAALFREVNLFGKEDKETARNNVDKMLHRDSTYVSAQEGVVGDPLSQIAQMQSIINQLVSKADKLAPQVDRLRRIKTETTAFNKAIKDVFGFAIDISDRLDTKPGEKEKSWTERFDELIGKVDLKGISAARIAELKARFNEYRSLAVDLDKEEKKAKIGSETTGLNALISGMFPKNEDTKYEAVKRFFETNKALAESYGPAKVETIARSAQAAFDFMNALKKSAEHQKELNDAMLRGQKILADLKLEKSDQDRIAIDLFGSFGVSSMADLSKLGSKEKQARDYIAEIAKIQYDKEHAAPANVFDPLKSYLLGPNKEFLGTTKDILGSARRRHDELVGGMSPADSFARAQFGHPLTSFNPAVQGSITQISTLFEELDKLDRYEKRVKEFGNTFTQIFSSAFDRVLTKNGNFFRALGEGMKSSLLRMGTQEASKGLYSLLSGQILRSGIFKKPKLSAESQALLNDTGQMVASLEKVLFNSGNVMMVRNVDGSTTGANGTIPTGGGKSLLDVGIGAASGGLDGIAGINTLKNAAETKEGKAAGLSKYAPLLGQIGIGLAINSVLGNPVGKAGNWLKKKIFGRATGGPMFAGTPYYFEGGKPEVFVPQVDGYMHNSSSTMTDNNPVVVNHYGDNHYSSEADENRVASKIASRVRLSRGYARI